MHTTDAKPFYTRSLPIPKDAIHDINETFQLLWQLEIKFNDPLLKTCLNNIPLVINQAGPKSNKLFDNVKIVVCKTSRLKNPFYVYNEALLTLGITSFQFHCLTRILLKLDPCHPFGKYLFISDKDKNVCVLEYDKSERWFYASEMRVTYSAKNLLLRFNGSKIGTNKSSNTDQENKKLLNLPKLRMIANGNCQDPIRCVISGQILEDIPILNFKTKKYEYSNFGGQLHHVKQYDNSSYMKEKEPSVLLKQVYTQRIGKELLMLVPLEISDHARFHIKNKIGFYDITTWEGMSGLLDYIPFAWQSEENFNSVVSVLEIYNFSYQDFRNNITWSDDEKQVKLYGEKGKDDSLFTYR